MCTTIQCDKTNDALIALLSAHTNYNCSEALNISLIKYVMNLKNCRAIQRYSNKQISVD